VADLDAHSLYSFAGSRYAGVGDDLYRDGVRIINGGLTGNRLSFVRMGPTIGVEDYLFLTDGAHLFKVDDQGNVTNWGIAAPTGAPVLAKSTQDQRVVDNMDATTGWSASSGTLASDATVKVEGTNSLRWTIANGGFYTATKNITVDLSTYASGRESPDADYITFWLRVDFPSDIVSFDVYFSLGNTTFSDDFYAARLNPLNTPIQANHAFSTPLGVSDLFGFFDNPDPVVEGEYNGPARAGDVVRRVAQPGFFDITNTWSRIRIPKLSFVRAGTNTSLDWSDVAAVRFAFRLGAGIVAHFDNMVMVGGYGLVGTYKYVYTYRNDTTGTRSLASPEATIEDLERQRVSVSGLAASPDAQADLTEIWRTLGNGAVFFKAAEQPDTTSTFTDNVADFAGFGFPEEAALLSETLPTSYTATPPTVGHCWGPFDGRMWTTRDSGAPGRVYFSPAAIAEVNEGFIETGIGDDPIQTGLVWNGRNWALSQKRLYRIDGNGPYTMRPIDGVPGLVNPYAAVATPVGIVYQAVDGIRVFDGGSSILLGFDAIAPVLSGEARENLNPFVATIAEFHNDEVILSDGSQTLAFNTTKGTWRDLGVGLAAVFSETGSGELLASIGGDVYSLEDGGTDEAISVDIGLSGYPSLPVNGIVFERVYLDIDTGGTPMTVTATVDGVRHHVGTITTTTRASIQLLDLRDASGGPLVGRVASLNIAGTLPAGASPLKLVRAWMDVYEPDYP
jgi:hypothetical protein